MLKSATNVHIINAGYIRNILFEAYSFMRELFSYDLLIKNPLTKKKIGTPGKYSEIENVCSTSKCDIV